MAPDFKVHLPLLPLFASAFHPYWLSVRRLGSDSVRNRRARLQWTKMEAMPPNHLLGEFAVASSAWPRRLREHPTDPTTPPPMQRLKPSLQVVLLPRCFACSTPLRARIPTAFDHQQVMRWSTRRPCERDTVLRSGRRAVNHQGRSTNTHQARVLVPTWCRSATRWREPFQR